MLVTFEVAEQEFALELESVQEILQAPAVVTAVPRAETLVLGVTSLRDRLLPLLSLRGLLGFPPAARDVERTFLVFRLGKDEFGRPIEAVDEVGEVPTKITRLPKTPKFLEGVVNLRGDVLPVVDQRRRFDMPAAEDGARRRLVVVRTERHRAGLIVDDVTDVLRVPGNSVEQPPDLTAQIARLVRGVINLDGAQRIVLVLDPSELLTPAEQERLDAFQKAGREGA